MRRGFVISFLSIVCLYQGQLFMVNFYREEVIFRIDLLNAAYLMGKVMYSQVGPFLKMYFIHVHSYASSILPQAMGGV